MVNRYKVLRVMNNNVILATDMNRGNEVVLMGNGLGFGLRKGEVTTFHKSQIEKAFVTGDEHLKQSYLQMLQEVSGDIVGVCSEILLKAEKELGRLSDRSFIVIVDHISFAIEKLKKGIRIENPFIFEIRHLYPEEYHLGEFARARILEEIGIDITEDEIGFIAMHLSAAKQHNVVSDTLKNTRIIKQMIEMVEEDLHVSLAGDPRLYNRLLLHLRGFVQRSGEGSGMTKHPLYEETVKACPYAHQLALRLANYLGRQKGIYIPETETFYLTLHMDRLIRKGSMLN